MEKKNNNIQEIIKDLTSKMNIIDNQLKIVFDSADKFKHKRHLIIYSYLMGYYTSKGNKNFNQDTLLNSLEIFERSLNRKTEFSNLIIALALSMNRCNENENNNQNNNQNNDKNLKKDNDNNNHNNQNNNDQNKENENNPPKNDITETMISNDPYIVYQQFFGTTVLERPLNKINNNEVININVNINEEQHKNIVKINNKPNTQINKINKQINREDGNKIEQKVEEHENINNVILINNKDNNNNKNNIILNIEDKNNKVNNHIIDIDANKKNNIENNIYNQKTQKYNINNNIGNNIYNQKTHKYNINNILNQQNNQKIAESYVMGKYNTTDKNNIQKSPKNFKQNTFIVPSNAKKIVKCFICSENFNELDKHNYRLNCKCVIHSKCFINYVVKSIKNKKIPILCPKCKKEVKNEIIYNCLNTIKDKKLIKLYEDYYLEIYIKNYEKNADLVYYCCPTPGCKKYIPCPKDENKLLCPNCNKSYCIKCFRPWHENKTCEQYYIENSVINNSEVRKEFLNFDAKNDFEYKECPKCKALMLKEEGTNKIICVCGTAFCYKCGKIIKEKHDCSSKEK